MTTAIKQMLTPSVDAEATGTPAADLHFWFSTSTADSAAVVAIPTPSETWRGYTTPEPRYAYLTWRTEVVRRRRIRPARQPVSAQVEDLRPEGVTHQELATWARSMMGGDTSDMLDI